MLTVSVVTLVHVETSPQSTSHITVTACLQRTLGDSPEQVQTTAASSPMYGRPLLLGEIHTQSLKMTQILILMVSQLYETQCQS